MLPLTYALSKTNPHQPSLQTTPTTLLGYDVPSLGDLRCPGRTSLGLDLVPSSPRWMRPYSVASVGTAPATYRHPLPSPDYQVFAGGMYSAVMMLRRGLLHRRSSGKEVGFIPAKLDRIVLYRP